MGRFSDLLGEKGIDAAPTPSRSSGYQAQEAPAKGQTEAATKSEFLVFNGHLKSASKGLKFRGSKDLKDIAKNRKLVEFGECVFGVPTDDGWLKVGRHYLPMEVQGVPVLVPTIGAETVEEPDPVDMWKRWKMPTPMPVPPDIQGTGTKYEVVHDRVVGRPAPSFAAPIQSVRSRGDVIELFEFDDTRKWRLGIDEKTNHTVWFLIDHEELGPLLRPQGQPFSAKPMDPVCVAAAESLTHDLQRFMDESAESSVYDASGRTPLMLAAAGDHVECCILLIEGGADPSLRSVAPCSPGRTAVQLAKSAPTKALLKAISGYKDFDVRLFDEVSLSLSRDFQETVDRLMDAAGRAIAKGLFLVEGKEPGLEQPDEFTPSPHPAQPAASSSTRIVGEVNATQATRSGGTPPRSGARGILHEVVYNAVWIRTQASTDSAKIAVKKRGDVVELFELAGDWARVEHEIYEGHSVPGWMLIKHEELGMLLKPLQEGNSMDELS